ncbi:response regulator [Telluribacter sp.]|jgi:CheY-like chemotaxis protein|uniref:response regulator n=1 Tax=Telluribacter sp. TaxID=1978767 RepID=UPI002E13E8E6|nr:response regulator [Telluribacter sp.]
MKKVDILYIEDNPDDVLFFERILKKIDDSLTFEVAGSGTEAISMLNGENSESIRPRLVLVDMNLPGLSGVEIVRSLRHTQSTRHLPLVIFSTSDSPTDIRSSYEAGATGYLVKSGSYKGRTQQLDHAHKFWIVSNQYF